MSHQTDVLHALIPPTPTVNPGECCMFRSRSMAEPSTCTMFALIEKPNTEGSCSALELIGQSMAA